MSERKPTRAPTITLSLAERQRRFRMTEELMTRFFSERRVEGELQRQIPGLTSGQARRLIDQVRTSWLASSCEDPEERRMRLRAAGEAVYTAAMNRTEQALDSRGKPIVDVDGQGRKIPRLIPAPDLKQANGALSFLARLDGLNKGVEVDGQMVLGGLASIVDAARPLIAGRVVDALPAGEDEGGDDHANGNGSSNGQGH